MQIRKMLSKDKQEVMKMMTVFYASDAVLSNGSAEIFERDIDACLGDSPYAEGYIFQMNGELAGYAMVAKSFSTEFGKACFWIEDIYIKPQFRGMGIGKQFFALLFSTYQDVVFRLEAEEENHHALSFYQKSGFEVLPYLEMIKK